MFLPSRDTRHAGRFAHSMSGCAGAGANHERAVRPSETEGVHQRELVCELDGRAGNEGLRKLRVLAMIQRRQYDAAIHPFDREHELEDGGGAERVADLRLVADDGDARYRLTEHPMQRLEFRTVAQR